MKPLFPTTLVLVSLLAAGAPLPPDSGAGAAAESDGPLLSAEAALSGRAAAERATVSAPAEASYDESLFGYSGALRVRTAMPGDTIPLPLTWMGARPRAVDYRWVPLARATDGDGAVGVELTDSARSLPSNRRVVAPASPGVYELELRMPVAQRLQRLRLIVLTPFDVKRNGRINGYRIGSYPFERSGRSDRYAPPGGFIEVTPDLKDLRLSEHLSLGEFLTHDQREHWPKYVALDTRLLDKLELVLDELTGSGVEADRIVVMSGYRTPQYNRRGLNKGRASLSRHQYGDAADVWVDNDGDWYMDDLNGDGKRDTRDARVMLEAVDRVERSYPALIGGAGVYPDNGAHGPFIHIDARGSRARW